MSMSAKYISPYLYLLGISREPFAFVRPFSSAGVVSKQVLVDHGFIIFRYPFFLAYMAIFD